MHRSWKLPKFAIILAVFALAETAFAAPKKPSARAIKASQVLAVEAKNAPKASGPEPTQLTLLSQLPPEKRSKLAPVIEASVNFKLEGGVDCTGTFISPSGHLLTALHCVSGCLTKANVTDKELAFPEPTSIGPGGKALSTYKVTVDDDAIPNLVCPGQVGSAKAELKVLLIGGKGWLTPQNSLAGFSNRYPDDYKELLDDGYEHGADFALLKVSDRKDVACLPLAGSLPANGKLVQAVSYPCLQRDDLDTKGTTPLYTAGVRTKGFEESDYYKSRKPAEMPFKAALVDRPDTFFSSLDIEKCGSGTGVVDESLQLVGVATRVYKSFTRYEFGSLEAVDVASVRKQIAKKADAADVKAIASCQLGRAIQVAKEPAKGTPEKADTQEAQNEPGERQPAEAPQEKPADPPKAPEPEVAPPSERPHYEDPRKRRRKKKWIANAEANGDSPPTGALSASARKWKIDKTK